jgi:hypothetical protein
MNGLGERWREHLRLSLLRALNSAPGYSCNESLLTDVMDEFGLGATRDQVRGELTWLAEQGLLTVETVAGVMIATLGERGMNVATGRTGHPGIKRPSPGR